MLIFSNIPGCVFVAHRLPTEVIIWLICVGRIAEMHVCRTLRLKRPLMMLRRHHNHTSAQRRNNNVPFAIRHRFYKIFIESDTCGCHIFNNYKGKQTGWMMYQAYIQILKEQLRLSARYAIFNTDSYDTRIYAYEKDVLYAFSVPALYATGSHTI